MKRFFERGGLWVLGQTALTLTAMTLGPFAADRSWAWEWSGLGALLIALGALFGIAGVKALGASRTVYPEPVHNGRLVQTGIYRLVRHPLYTSLMLISSGWGLWWNAPSTLALAAALSLVLVGKAQAEERWLRAKYPEYSQYASLVPRFFPRLSGFARG